MIILPICPSVLNSRESSSELYVKGARLAINGELDSAIPVFRKVIDLSPSYCMGHYGLGKAYLYKHGMLGEAVKHLKASVLLDRKFVKGYFYLGIAYFLARNYLHAAQAFKTAYNLDDSYIEALYNLGVVYDIMDNKYASQVYFTKFFNKKVKKEEDIIF
jgi:tetratricopeptide (TPR) repeat protein